MYDLTHGLFLTTQLADYVEKYEAFLATNLSMVKETVSLIQAIKKESQEVWNNRAMT